MRRAESYTLQWAEQMSHHPRTVEITRLCQRLHELQTVPCNCWGKKVVKQLMNRDEINHLKNQIDGLVNQWR